MGRLMALAKPDGGTVDSGEAWLTIGAKRVGYAVWVNRAHGACLLIFLAGVGPVNGLARAQIEVDPSTVLRLAIDKYEKAKDSKTRFTYFELNHIQNFNEKGKKTIDYTQLFEVTYIADLEYLRLREINGRALSRNALEEEQKRYDDAVRERSALDGFARAKIQHQKMLDAGINLTDLVTEYRISAVDRVTMEDRNCVTVDLLPVSIEAKKHYRLWIDPSTDEIRRLEFDELADEHDLLSGARGSETFQYLDGVPLIVHAHFDGRARLNNQTARVVADHAYSQFRKFSVITKIVPIVPEEKP